MDDERKKLYNRINLRVDKMIEKGLIKEVESLMKYRKLNSLKTVGYQEIFEYLDGSSSLEDTIIKIKQNTRRYAKRQITWLRHLDYTTVYTFMDYDNIESRVRYFLNEQQ